MNTLNYKAMKPSKLVEQLLERNKKTPLQVYAPGQTEKKLCEPDEKLTNDAYNKICELWNKDEKSRGFIKYLIRSYFPLQPTNQILTFSGDASDTGKNRCCILNIKIAGLKEISDSWKPLADLQEKEEVKVVDGKIRYSKGFMKKRYEILQKMPIEVRKSTIGYFSTYKGCEKYLSGEAHRALEAFVEECVDNKEKEVISILNQKEQEEHRKTAAAFNAMQAKRREKTEKDKEKNYGFTQFVDEETLKKLQGLKKEGKK